MRKIDENLLVGADEDLLQIIRKINAANLPDEECRLYEEAIKAYMDKGATGANGFSREQKQGWIEGWVEGYKQGRMEERKRIVMLLKAKGYSIEEIADIFQWTIDSVRSLME